MRRVWCKHVPTANVASIHHVRHANNMQPWPGHQQRLEGGCAYVCNLCFKPVPDCISTPGHDMRCSTYLQQRAAHFCRFKDCGSYVQWVCCWHVYRRRWSPRNKLYCTRSVHGWHEMDRFADSSTNVPCMCRWERQIPRLHIASFSGVQRCCAMHRFGIPD